MYSSKQKWWKEVERDLIDDPCCWIRPKPVPKSDVCATIAAQPTNPKIHLNTERLKFRLNIHAGLVPIILMKYLFDDYAQKMVRNNISRTLTSEFGGALV